MGLDNRVVWGVQEETQNGAEVAMFGHTHTTNTVRTLIELMELM